MHINCEDEDAAELIPPPQKDTVRRCRDCVMIASVLLGLCGIGMIACLQSQSDPTETYVTREGVGCNHPIYCTGDILSSVQRAKIFNDSKTFVDMPIKTSVQQVQAEFANITNKSDPAALRKLVNDNFLKAGWEVTNTTAPDWVPNPTFLQRITDHKLSTFAHAVHNIWNHLIRRYNTTGLCPDCYSSMHLPNNFVVPGGRFREFYYWDTYWILEGLYVSGMTTTAKGVIENLASLIARHGFIPNGARLYYLNRSQPPLFAKMLQRYVSVTGDKSVLANGIKAVETEYHWWMRQRTVSVVSSKTGLTHVVNNYNVVNVNGPRPESFTEDEKTASAVPAGQRMSLYSNIASAAESGWDFSSRWLNDPHPVNKSISSINTSAIIPVDLNSALYHNELLLFQWSQNSSYKEAADRRQSAILDLLWSPSRSFFVDYNMTSGSQARDVFPSGCWPVWVGVPLSHSEMANFIQTTESLITTGGVPTSTRRTGQQWDYPNAWAPLQHVMMEVLHEASHSAAEKLATSWVASNYCGWNQTGYMFEKYNVTHPGIPGTGGEYTVQEGFGWTNGVALWALNTYPNMTSPPFCLSFTHTPE